MHHVPRQGVRFITHSFPEPTATSPISNIQDNDAFQIGQLYSLTIQL